MKQKAGRKILVTADEIKRMYREDEFVPYIIFGGLGYGKSSYAIQSLALAYGEKDKPDWNAVKKRIIFTPEEFVDIINKSKEKRDMGIIWDDAGVWLYSLDYYTPLIKAITKYLSVARTDFATILFTTPQPEWIVRKGRNIPKTRLARIIKISTVEFPSKEKGLLMYKYRQAVVYTSWRSPDGKRYGTKTIYRDNFNAILPDDFYEWYKPMRNSYAKIVKKMIVDEMAKKRYQNKLAKKIAPMLEEDGDDNF